MSYGTNLGITLPTIGATAWGGDLNTILQTIIDVLQAKVTPAGFNVNVALELNDNELTEAKYVNFTNNSSSQTATRSLWFKSGELYVVDGSGNEIQLTSGGSFNSSILGGITGIAGTSAALTYTSAVPNFAFTSTPGTYSRVDSADLHIHEGSTSASIALAAPTGLSSDVTITLPTHNLTGATALPTTSSLVKMDENGQMSYVEDDYITINIGAGSFVSSGSAAVPATEFGTVHMTTDPFYLPLNGIRKGDVITDIKAQYDRRSLDMTVKLWATDTGAKSGSPFATITDTASSGYTTGSMWGAGEFPLTASADTKMFYLEYDSNSIGNYSIHWGAVVYIKRPASKIGQ